MRSIAPILRFVIAHFGDVDTRDHAWLLLQMLTHLSKDRLNGILCGVPMDQSVSARGVTMSTNEQQNPNDSVRQSHPADLVMPSSATAVRPASVDSSFSYAKATDTMSKFRPQTFEGILKTQPMEFLNLRRNLNARRRVGLRDGGSADIMVLEPKASRKEKYCIDTMASESVSKSPASETNLIPTTALLSAYGMALWGQIDESRERKADAFSTSSDRQQSEDFDSPGISPVPCSIHLPLVIQFHGQSRGLVQHTDNEPNGSKTPDRIYSIVLEFSPSPNCVPLDSITLPFLCAPQATPASPLVPNLRLKMKQEKAMTWVRNKDLMVHSRR